MEHLGAVFKLDLTEETRTQLQEEAIASSCLILATPTVCLYVELNGALFAITLGLLSGNL